LRAGHAAAAAHFVTPRLNIVVDLSVSAGALWEIAGHRQIEGETRVNEHQKQIGEAVKTVLGEILRREKARREEPLRKVTDRQKAMSLNELDRHIDQGHDFVYDPIGVSLRLGIREAGQILARMGTTAEMHDVAEFAADDDEHGIDIIDHAWHGIQTKDGGRWFV
jgi:hypothetical protein